MTLTSRICGWTLLTVGLVVASPALAQDDQQDDEQAVEQHDDQHDEQADDIAEEQPDANQPQPDEQPDQLQDVQDDDGDEGFDDDAFDDDAFDDADDNEEWPDEWDDDEFEEFDDIEFEPLDDIDDQLLDGITPVATFPHLDWSGQLRVRPRLRSNFDLDTRGTSAVLPPVDTVLPEDQPADPEANSLWTTDLRLRLAPTLHLSETLRVHTDIDFLHNVSMGADPRHHQFIDQPPSVDRRLMHSAVGRPGPVQVREAYGELHAFFGTLQAGRMLDHWGLGITANDGRCADCDWGDHVDRLALRTSAFDWYGRIAYELPDSGIAPDPPGIRHDHPYALGGLDRAGQWSLAIFNSPVTRQDYEEQLHQLNEGQSVINTGLYFTHRVQTGEFPYDHEQFDLQFDDQNIPEGRDQAERFDPVYRGLNLFRLSPWVQFLWEPQPDHQYRVELEGITTLGGIDNVTDRRVGFDDPGDDATQPGINCFDDDEREANPGACRTGPDGESTDEFVQQFGLAAESEFRLGGPLSFGLNTGFASGGPGEEDAGNWGYGAAPRDRLDFTRFSPDYHVDLILFREIIGTVTNAYYANPYVKGEFFDTGAQHIELQLDGIASRAFDPAGTPGDSPWLGLELDATAAYVVTDRFLAAIDGGILFPMGGLAAREGRERLNYYGDPGPFVEDRDPSIAWTVQGRLNWHF